MRCIEEAQHRAARTCHADSHASPCVSPACLSPYLYGYVYRPLPQVIHQEGMEYYEAVIPAIISGTVCNFVYRAPRYYRNQCSRVSMSECSRVIRSSARVQQLGNRLQLSFVDRFGCGIAFTTADTLLGTRARTRARTCTHALPCIQCRVYKEPRPHCGDG